MTTKSPKTELKLQIISDSIRVKEVTSSFALEARNEGLGASSFVSYTVEASPEKHPEGWTMSEARIVEAMLAQRVSKDLYADLAARKLVEIPNIAARQKQVTQQYDRLIDKLGDKAVEADLDDISATAETLEAKENSLG